MASSSLEILIRFVVKEENRAAFEAASGALVASISAAEPRTSGYTFFVSPDGTSAVLHERYPDSEAFLAHIARSKDELPPLLAAASLASFYVLGSPSPAAREVLEGFGAKCLAPAAGFAR